MLFVSVEGSADIVEAAIAAGAQGYIPKADVESKLLPALDALFLKK
jgi:DNA-binding NarL/FixJ family response regulator